MKKLILVFLFIANVSSIPAQDLQIKVSGSGPVLVFIPGLSSSGIVWDETVNNLSQHYECHVLTLPGFVENPPAEISKGFFNTMDQLVSNYVLKQQKPVTLIGHSLGGFLALRISRMIPHKITRTIIVDSYPFYSAALNPAATEESVRELAHQAKEMIRTQSQQQYADQQKMAMGMMTTSAERIPVLVNWSIQSDRATVAQAFYELMTIDFRQELADVNVPVLVLGAWASGKSYGLTEERVKSVFTSQYQLAKDIQIEMAPSAFHFIMWDNPDWFLEKVRQFLAR